MALAHPFTVATVAGSDPTGGAGLQGDLATFFAHGVRGTAIVTAITVQNHRGVRRVEVLAPDLVTAQVEALFEQARPGAMKTGMLGTGAVARALAASLRALPSVPLVVDPVLRASAGGALADPDLLPALVATLFPLATLVTPNLEEAAALLGRPVGPEPREDDARELRERCGTAAVLLKGGHGAGPVATDLLATRDGVEAFALPRLAARDGHGTGCALSAAIAARLALGHALRDAVRGAKGYVARALAAAGPLGAGRGSVRHDVPADGA